MSISTNFDSSVVVYRLAQVGSSNRREWGVGDTVPCHIQPTNGEQVQLADGAFYDTYRMWCAVDADVVLGDKVVDGSITYVINALKTMNFGKNRHKVSTLVLGI